MADDHEHVHRAAEPAAQDHDAHDHDEHEHHHHDHDHEHDSEPIDYEDAVAEFRRDKDEFFKTGPRSPVPVDARASFEGIPYFPIDLDLRFEDLALQPYTGSEPSHFQIPTSDGQLRPAHRAGTFQFDIGGEARSLTAYVLNDGDPAYLFVPFLDATSGTETYGAGRYLDLEPEDDGTYALDFNLAYHPSCVYDVIYSCPLTPAENRLPDRIEAGERLAEGHQ